MYFTFMIQANIVLELTVDDTERIFFMEFAEIFYVAEHDINLCDDLPSKASEMNSAFACPTPTFTCP